MWAIQYVEEAESVAQAREWASHLGRQDGALATRVIGDGRSKPWAAQAIFADDSDGGPLPDGCRRVFVPRGFTLACCI